MLSATLEPASSPILSVDLLRAADRSEIFSVGWTDEKLRQAVADYEKFLKLAAKYTDIPLAPTRDIDAVWHLHMLHPVAYANDCERLLGYTLDHDGGFGQTPDELPVLKKVFARTADLWEREYGEPYLAAGNGMTKCVRDCQSRCWHACNSVRSDACNETS